MQYNKLYNTFKKKINTLNRNRSRSINYYLISLVINTITYIKNNIYKELGNIKILIELK
jgi:hypothetical protein